MLSQLASLETNGIEALDRTYVPMTSYTILCGNLMRQTLLRKKKPATSRKWVSRKHSDVLIPLPSVPQLLEGWYDSSKGSLGRTVIAKHFNSFHTTNSGKLSLYVYNLYFAVRFYNRLDIGKWSPEPCCTMLHQNFWGRFKHCHYCLFCFDMLWCFRCVVVI